MIKIGITGGIGSGKSVISDILKIKGIPVYDTDNAAKYLISHNDNVKTSLKQLLGEDIFKDDQLDRKKMASLIFNDKKILQQTNSIIHPAVIDDFVNWAQKKNSPIVGCESAILYEAGMNKFLDFVILVTSPVNIRIERCITRDSASFEEIKARIKNQANDNEKIKLSDFIVNNDNQKALIPQINTLLESIKSH